MNDLKMVTAKTFAKNPKLQIIGCVLLDVEPTDLAAWFPWVKFVIFNFRITTGMQPQGIGFLRKINNTSFISDDSFDRIDELTLEQVKMLGPLWSPHTGQKEGLTKLTYMLQQKKCDMNVVKYLVNELKFDINEK